jgi:hypothetical protein
MWFLEGQPITILLKQQIFFIFRSKDNMLQQTDQMCTTIIIGIVVVLICMGCVEMTKMHTRYDKQMSACGRKAEVGVTNSSVSAKESELTNTEPNMTGNTPEQLATLEESWSLSVPESECKHTEHKQVEEELMRSYNEWQAAPEETAKFPVIDKAAIKKHANTRSSGLHTQIDSTGSGKTGVPGVWMTFHQYANPKQQKVMFGDHAPVFNGSDAHFAARANQA